MPEINSTTPTHADKTATMLQPPTTAKQKPVKPSKPYPEFPLTAHPAADAPRSLHSP